MDGYFAPENISHESLLAALQSRPFCADAYTDTLYETQLRHRLLTLARKARLEVAAHELTGLPASELTRKSTTELVQLMDAHRAGLKGGDASVLRYLW